MEVLDKLTKLMAAGGFGKLGDDVDGNIFIGKLPYAPNAAIALFPLELLKAKQGCTKVQVIVRGDGQYGAALSRAQGIADFFDGYKSPEDGIHVIKAEDAPIGIGMDKNGRYEFSFNIIIWGELQDTDLWFTFKNTDSRAMGVVVLELPPRHGAKERGVSLLVPGRDGQLWLYENTLDNREIMIDCKVRLDTNLDDIALWLRGSGKLVLSGDGGRALKARLSRGIDFERQENCYGMLLFLLVEPHLYEEIPSTMTLTAPSAITNLGNVPSLPLIRIVGNGDIQLAVGGYALSLSNVEGEITLDSTWIGNVTRIELTPNWRWV